MMMHHVDEHRLELYVLGSDLAPDEQDAIVQHVKECAGCRSLVEQITSFYERTAEDLQNNPEQAAVVSEALVRSDSRLVPHSSPYVTRARYRMPSRGQQFFHIVRRYPIASAFVGVSMAAGLAVALMFGIREMNRDANPTFERLNPELSRVEIFNGSGELLWNLPTAKDLMSSLDLDPTGIEEPVVLRDLDGDGANEVITNFPVLARGTGRDIRLRVFNADQSLRFERSISVTAQYRDVKYPEELFIQAFLVDDFDGDGKPEMLARGAGYRSPNVIVRYDARGEVLGEYWHFGVISRMVLIPDSATQKKRLIILGRNDHEDGSGNDFPFLAELAPDEIVGTGRSSLSPGFPSPPSRAEKVYLRMIKSDMEIAKSLPSTSMYMYKPKDMSHPVFQLWVGGGRTDETGNKVPSFEYHFDANLVPLFVKSAFWTDRFHDALVRQGLVTGRIDAKYLEHLKNGIRYWNGQSWTDQPCRIDYNMTAALQP